MLSINDIYSVESEVLEALNSPLKVFKQNFLSDARYAIYLGGCFGFFLVDTCPELSKISHANLKLKVKYAVNVSQTFFFFFLFNLYLKLSRGKSSASTDVLAVQIKFTTQVCGRIYLVRFEFPSLS